MGHKILYLQFCSIFTSFLYGEIERAHGVKFCQFFLSINKILLNADILETRTQITIEKITFFFYNLKEKLGN